MIWRKGSLARRQRNKVARTWSTRWREHLRELLIRLLNRVRVRSGDLNVTFHHHRLGWNGRISRLTLMDEACTIVVPDPFDDTIRHHHQFDQRGVWLIEGAYFDHKSGVSYLNGNAIRDTARSATKKVARFRVLRPNVRKAPSSPVIVTGQNPKNYFHWLLEDLPAVLRAKQAVPAAEVLVGSPQPGYVKKTLEMAGAGPATEIRHDLRNTRIVVAGQGADTGWPHPTDIRIIRDAFSHIFKDSEKENQGLYISRGVSRRSFLNETEVATLMEQLGLRVIQPERLGLEEQIKLFASASTIVGPHGAGLTNIVFCSPNTRVIELALQTRAIQTFEVISRFCDLKYTRALIPAPANSEMVEVSEKTTAQLTNILAASQVT